VAGFFLTYALNNLTYALNNLISKKWKNAKGKLAEFCGLKSMKK